MGLELIYKVIYGRKELSLCPAKHKQVPFSPSQVADRRNHRLAPNDLVATGAESIGDLGEVVLLEVGEDDSIVALRDRAAGIELASDGGGKSHAGGGHASDKKV